jgi:hypothetical protein
MEAPTTETSGLNPEQRKTLHAQLLDSAVSDAPPAMARFIAAVRRESEAKADAIEAGGDKVDRQGMFATRLAQYLPALYVAPEPELQGKVDRRSPQLLDEIQSPRGRQTAALLKEHALGFLQADRDARYEAQQASAGPSVHETADVAERRRVNEPFIDKMLDQDVTAEERAHLQRDLGALPPDMIREAAEAGVHIFIARQGMTELPTRLRPPDRDPAELGAQWDRFHASMAERRQRAAAAATSAMSVPYGETNGGLSMTAMAERARHVNDAAIAATSEPMPASPPGWPKMVPMPIQPMPFESALPGGFGSMLPPAAMFGSPPTDLPDMPVPPMSPPPPAREVLLPAWPPLPQGEDARSAELASQGPVLPPGLPGVAAGFGPLPPPPTPGSVADLITRTPQPGETMAEIARAHGASTPREVDEFLDLSRHMNAFEGQTFDPHAPFEPGQMLVIPDLFYRNGNRYSASRMLEIEEERGKLPNDGKTAGCFQYSSKLLLLDERVLPDPSPLMGHNRTAVHELGHFVHDLRRHREQNGGQGYEARLNSLFVERQRKALGLILMARAEAGPHATDEQIQHVIERSGYEAAMPMVTPYSAKSPDEMHAEGYRTYHTDRFNDPQVAADASRDIMKLREPDLFLLARDDEAFFADPRGAAENARSRDAR